MYYCMVGYVTESKNYDTMNLFSAGDCPFYLLQDKTSSLKENDETPTFQWVEFKSHRKCRNSVQGYKLIVDDLGWYNSDEFNHFPVQLI